MSSPEPKDQSRKEWDHGPGPAGRCIPIGKIKDGKFVEGNIDYVKEWGDTNFELQQFVHVRDSLKKALRKLDYLPNEFLVEDLLSVYQDICNRIATLSVKCDRLYIQNVRANQEAATKGESEDA